MNIFIHILKYRFDFIKDAWNDPRTFFKASIGVYWQIQAQLRRYFLHTTGIQNFGYPNHSLILAFYISVTKKKKKIMHSWLISAQRSVNYCQLYNMVVQLTVVIIYHYFIIIIILLLIILLPCPQSGAGYYILSSSSFFFFLSTSLFLLQLTWYGH